MIKCCLCLKDFESENPAILSFGHYGNPRYLCPECEARVDTVTLGTDVAEIEKNMDEICAFADKVGKDDFVTADAVEEILTKAGARAAAIKDGTYDFANDEVTEDGDLEEVPEELLETEEDKAADEKETVKNKKIDTFLNVISALGILAVLGFIVYSLIVNV